MNIHPAHYRAYKSKWLVFLLKFEWSDIITLEIVKMLYVGSIKNDFLYMFFLIKYF